MKVLLLLAVLIVSTYYLTPLYPVLAVEGTTSSTPAKSNASARQTIISNTKDRIASRVSALKARIEDKKEQLASRAATRKDNIKERIEQRRELQASREATLKVRLEKFKDQRRALLVEKVNDNLNTINDRKTTHMSERLEKMVELLKKLEERVNKLNSEGEPMPQTQAQIAAAESAIEAAQSAVDAQAGKDYTISVSSESAAKEDAKVKRDALHNDLKAVHDLVVTARKAVAEAFGSAAAEGGEKGE